MLKYNKTEIIKAKLGTKGSITQDVAEINHKKTHKGIKQMISRTDENRVQIIKQQKINKQRNAITQGWAKYKQLRLINNTDL
jgi:hypothetical protein